MSEAAAEQETTSELEGSVGVRVTDSTVGFELSTDTKAFHVSGHTVV